MDFWLSIGVELLDTEEPDEGNLHVRICWGERLVTTAPTRHRHFNPALERSGLPRIRFHDLRHTYASLLFEQGENPKYIQTQLGHSNPTVTLNI